ncbi:MAG: methyltransferase domain-containing protein [Chloroflexi bacterium]|uniref:RNA methyltransferase n=1 Tax=Candidatus Thermofonsia Clade 3 bacterium TaxID=2364212 RepID=A0A2M8QEV5_9CHLR|nr:methyltransferase domain-containing protein [Candidatus Roseilinea sp. NK_OTU-006]PJF48337.1 MAG: RNA methyltransferase [Candidatus Thermofonsia Clade 3 bacterium]RMG62266.1 MAG: methyltransferase domain-containing protein [Chloroflexota bacterium]
MGPHCCEADVIAGLEPFVSQELAALGVRHAHVVQPRVIQFSARALRPLLGLHMALSVYLLRRYAVARPKALLGDQHLRALFTQVDAALGLAPHGAYRTFMLGAAGAGSTVMTRLKSAIAQHTGLREAHEEGDLLIRIRPSRGPFPDAQGGEAPQEATASSRSASGWDVLVRLSPKPLATRAWRVCNIPGSLQATVAHAMAWLTRPTPDDVYLNLGCGSGTLLIERAAAGPARRLIGCDTDPHALTCAQANIAAYQAGAKGERHPFELREWDMRCLPLPDASVDAITADLPFGHRVGSHDDNMALYPALLREAARVAKPGARCVFITAEVRLMESALAQTPSPWLRDLTFRVNLGGLRPAIFALRRA